MSEVGKIAGVSNKSTVNVRSGKTYEQIRQQALRLTNALGAQARGNAPEPHPGESNFWAGYETPRGRTVATIAGRYMDNIREVNGLPVDYDTNDKRANTKYPRSVYARRNNRRE